MSKGTPIVHALHGFVGSGKTTFAAKLEAAGVGVSLSQDDWMVRLYGNNPPADKFQDYFDRVWALLMDEAARFLEHGVSVILDRGFWSVESRRAIRHFALQHNAEFKLYYLKADIEVMRSRVLARNAALTSRNCFYIDDNAFNLFKTRFQPLGPDEPHEVVST